jgi:hypothetical protein
MGPGSTGDRNDQQQIFSATEYAENGTVERLYRYLPFDADASFLYEEYVQPDSRLEYEAQALRYVRRLCASPEVRLVVLTGNAGHGKTHLCRRMLEDRGYDSKTSMQRLREDPPGAVRYGGAEGRSLRIVKDLSEIPEGKAADLLANLAEDPDAIGLVCANEGKLRDVASRDPGRLSALLHALEATLEQGRTSHDGRVHVVNLNFQSVAPRENDGGGTGFFEHAVEFWTRDGRKWNVCGTCRAADRCPIVANRNRLNAGRQGDDAARRRRAGLLQLVRIAEETGYVLTYREALIFVAYLLTGGLTCGTVHRLHREGADLDASHAFEVALFEKQLSTAEVEQLGIVKRIRMLDPGRASLREVDERLHRELEDQDHLGGEALVSAKAPARTRRDLEEERRVHQRLIRRARRRDFFVHPGLSEEGDRERARRLGFHHYAEFQALLEPDVKPDRMIDVLERVISGLHVIQGVRSTSRSFAIVDPAFARDGNKSAVIARTIPQKKLLLTSESKFWSTLTAVQRPEVTQATDWLDRRVVLSIEDRQALTPIVFLDLLQFEFVLQSARGVVFEQFHAADRRRLLARLARHAEVGTQEEEIRIVDGNAMRAIWVERDGRIEVGEAP